MTDLYFKTSKSRGKQYLQIWSRTKGFLVSLGSVEKCYSDSVRLKELKEQTEKYHILLTEIYKGTSNKMTENKYINEIPPLLRENSV